MKTGFVLALSLPGAAIAQSRGRLAFRKGMPNHSIHPGNSFMLILPVKRKRPMLASNPPRNTDRWELLANGRVSLGALRNPADITS
jgi:hypothetical protein